MAGAKDQVADGRAEAVTPVGFLGAGKTTLLRHLEMSEEDITGTVVVVNELGEVDDDAVLEGLQDCVTAG